MIKAFNFPLCYLIGSSLFISSSASQNELPRAEKNVRFTICLLATGAFIHYVLNMFVNFDRTDRHVIDFWSKKDLSATGQASLACLIIGVAAAILFSNTSKKKKFLAVIILVLVTIYNLILSGRTLFLFMIISLLAAYFYKSYVNKTNVLKTVIVLVLIVALLVIMFNANVFNIKTAFESSNFYNRFYGGEYTQEIDDDSRMQHKIYYLTHLGDSMLGGGHLRASHGQYAHDLYLDTYDESSIFAALLIIIYVIASLTRMIKCLKSKTLSLKTKQLILGVYLLVNIMFFIEPIISGSPWLLFTYCFIDGAVAYMLRRLPTKQAADQFPLPITEKGTEHI